MAHRDRARGALYQLVWLRLNRAAQRFASLYARWKEGKLRPCRMGKRSADLRSATNPPLPTLPRKRLWLVVLIPQWAAGYAIHLRRLLDTHPDVAEFLKAAPQAGRILRPLCHALGMDLPASLPPLKPRPRPANPTPRPRKPVGRKSEAPSATPPAPQPPPAWPPQEPNFYLSHQFSDRFYELFFKRP